MARSRAGMTGTANSRIIPYIYMLLLDGRKIRLAEILPHIYRRISPVMAIREYERMINASRNRDNISGKTHELAEPKVEYKIEQGRYRILHKALYHAVARGILLVEWSGIRGEYKDAVLSLTPFAFVVLKSKGGKRGVRNSTAGAIWNEIRALWESGQVKISVELARDYCPSAVLSETEK